MPFNTIIYDEMQMLASPTSQRSKAALKLKAEHKFGLTATPILNSPMDIWMPMNILRPGCLGSWYQFSARYISKDVWGSPKFFKNMDELSKRCAPYIIKRTLEEVGMQLPPYTEEELPVTLNALERKNYDLMKAELLFSIEPMVISKIENPVMLQSSIVKLGKLMEICDSMELIGDHKDSSKLELLKEHLEGSLVDNNKCLIVTRFERMARILERELVKWNPLLITGQTQNRQDIVDKFNNEDDFRILIGTATLESGLNLQRANLLYNFDLAWNPARMTQRAGRIYRNGQEKPVFIYNLVCEKTVETWLQRKLIKKQELADKLLPTTFVELKEMLNA